MEVIELNNGKIILVDSNKDILEAVEEYCSRELSSLISNKLVDVDKEKLYAESRAATDADNYLSSLESVNSLMNDVINELEEITEYMEDTKRVDKNKIYQKLFNIIREIKMEL